MLQNKNFSKLLSLALAIALWVYVVTVENPPTKVKISDIPIQLVNVESLTQRGLAISSDDTYHMDIIIEGTRSDVLKVSAEDIIATADVFGYNAGENYIPVEVTVPSTVDVAEKKTNVITVNIEELVSVYKPVSIEFQGKLDEKYEATVFETMPQEVEVKGAKSKVARVKEVKGVINTSELPFEKQDFTVDLSPIDANGNEVSNVKLSSETAAVQAAIYEIKEVPLEVEIKGEVSSDYQVSDVKVPEKIKIKGLKSDLKKVSEVKAKAVDISGVTATTDIPLELNLPDGIMLTQDYENVAVSITIKGISVKTFEIEGSQIAHLNLKNGCTAAVNTQSVSVRITGKEDVMENLTADDINLTIDLKDLSEGMHVVDVHASVNGEVSDISVTPSEVHITINEAV
ncbi:MAG: YbbR-like domain-containing protein [Anaerovoracaceae bacterium]